MRVVKLQQVLEHLDGVQSELIVMAKMLKLAMLMLALTVTGLTACGKRGEPYRPSEIPAKSGESTS